MKKVFLLVALMATALTPSFAQDSTQQYQLPQLLIHYYNVKNALVVGDANAASANALAFVKAVNSIDYKVISEGNILPWQTMQARLPKAKTL